MIIVSNTTPLIGLASIGKFHLLHDLFIKVYIPQAVYKEAVVLGYEEGGAKEEVISASAWMKVIQIQDQLAVNVLLDELDIGEAETIVLACEMNASWVLMDEKKGRRKLNQLSLQKIGTVGILLKAKKVGLLSEIRPHLKQLRSQGFSISDSVSDSVLKQSGE